MKLAFLVWAATVGLLGQSFEVATIKPTPPDWKGGRYIRMLSAHQMEARNQSVKTLIASAWNVSPLAVSGVSDWSAAPHYDILAKTPGEKRPTSEEQMAMLRTLVTDRFQLRFHRETKEMPVYALTTAKTGPRLKPTAVRPDATPEGPPPLVFTIRPDGVSLHGLYATMGEFAYVLQRGAMNRPVIDLTGITGRYDFDLDFFPDETQFGGLGLKLNPDRPVPDLYAALQEQLGLKLEATRGPVETFVVDHAETPSGN